MPTEVSILSVMEGKWEAVPVPIPGPVAWVPSKRRSEAGVLSMATLMGEGQAAVLGRVMAEARPPGEASDWVSQKPEYTARWGTGAVNRHSCGFKTVEEKGFQ